MKPLKRPMFRTGGPIKEGVMNGLKDGGVATYMADATMMAGGGMPNMRGRVTGPGGYAGLKDKAMRSINYARKNPIKTIGSGIGSGIGFDVLFNIINNASAAGLFAKGGLADLPPMRGMVTGPGKYSQDKNLIDTAGNILKKSVGQTVTDLKKNPVKTVVGGGKKKFATGILNKGGGMLDNLLRRFNIQTFPKRIPSSGGMGGVKLTPGQIQAGMGTQPLSFFQRVNMFRKANPKTFYGGLGVGTTSGAIPFGGAKLAELGGNLGLEVADRLVSDKFFDQDKVIGGNVREVYGKVKKALGFGDKKDDDDDDKVLPPELKPKIKKSKEQIEAERKELDDKKLARIYKLLGVDRAKRNAASKALIDMSRYIDEQGKDAISKKNIGSTISKAISAFDTRLDKVDQLKEAAGLMRAKAIVEAEADPLKKKIQEAQLTKLTRENSPDVTTSIQNSMVIKKGALTEQETVNAVRVGASNEGKKLVSVISEDDVEDNSQYKGKSVVEIVKELDPEDGYYVIGKSVIEVESGEPKLITGKSLLD